MNALRLLPAFLVGVAAALLLPTAVAVYGSLACLNAAAFLFVHATR